MEQLGELADELIAHPIRTRSQQLDHQHLAIAIDDDARKPIAIAIDEAIAIAVARSRPARATRARRSGGVRCSSGIAGVVPHASIRTAMVVEG